MERIKGYLIAAGNVIVFLLVGWIYYLTQKVGSLKSEVARKDAEKELGKVLDEKTKADTEARGAVDDFKRAMSDYKPGDGSDV